MKTLKLKIIAVVLCFLGINQSLAQTDTWQYLDPMPFPRGFAASAVLNGKIYIIGGVYNVDLDATATVLVFDPVTESWDSKFANLPVPLARAAAAVLDGKIYVTGGHRYSAPEALNGVYMYDPEANAWITRSSMQKPRFYHEMAVVNGMLYAMGGRSLDWNAIDKTVERYIPQTDTWQNVASMHKGRGSFATEVFDGKIYVIGGADGGIVLPDVEMYDPETDTWTVLENMPAARWGNGSGFYENQIYVFGGASNIALPGMSTWDMTGDWLDMGIEMSDTAACFTYGMALDINDAPCFYAIGGVRLEYWVPGGTGPYTMKAVRKFCPGTVAPDNVQANSDGILQCFPNPFNYGTTVLYTLQSPGQVCITIYDLAGNSIATPFDGFQPAGEHNIAWHADGLASGIYVCQLMTEENVVISKMVGQN